MTSARDGVIINYHGHGVRQMERDDLILRELQKINSRLGGLEDKVDTLQSDVSGLKSDVAVLKSDVSKLKVDVARLQTDVASLQADMTELKEAHEVTRSGVNTIIEWTEAVSLADRFPLPRL